MLTIAERLRHHGVVGKFVEFYGPGVAAVPLENRATIGNMSPEYGSTCAMFPIDAETLRYLRFTGRPPEQIALVEAYAKEQGLFHEPGAPDPTFSERVEIDLATVVPSIAGPSRPHDRVPLTDATTIVSTGTGRDPVDDERDDSSRGPDEASAQSFPASDPPASNAGRSKPAAPTRRPEPEPSPSSAEAMPDRPSHPTTAVLADGAEVTLDHGDVVIAAITSCTNTSNPSVMIAAGLLAQKAVARGLRTKPWVKTSLAPGSRVVTDYLAEAGLVEPLEALGYHLVGYGCTTCIGNSGPLLDGVSDAVTRSDLAVCAVLSGNRNFEGRIHPDVRMNYLASPPLVVAYAIAGTLDTDLVDEPLGVGTDGTPVFLRDIWPTSTEVAETVRGAIRSEMFRQSYEHAFTGDENWRSLDVATGTSFDWEPSSSYIRRPPFFEGMGREPEPVRDIVGARVLAVLGDSITTDHISPAGSIKPDSPAGRYLVGARPGAVRLQLLRRSARQPRGDGAGHVRQRPAAQPPRAGHRGRPHRAPARRRAVVDLRRGRSATATRASRSSCWRAPTTAPGRRGTGRPKARCCSASRPCWPRASSASTAPTSSTWASCRSSSSTATPSRPSASPATRSMRSADSRRSTPARSPSG